MLDAVPAEQLQGFDAVEGFALEQGVGEGIERDAVLDEDLAGTLVHAGEERLHPEEDRGLAGPVSTVQLANFRRGLQDHQYLTLARDLGLAREVREALGAIVPRVFSDAGERVSFPETGDPYERARLGLARAIVAARRAER